MAFRKNRRTVMAAAAVCSLLMLSGCAAAPMGEHSELSFQFFGSHSSYYSDFTAETEDGGYRIQGTANLGSDTENGIVRMSAEEEQTATVEGALDGKKGSLRLVYTAADGTETVIAECEDASYEAFDTSLKVTEEESVLKLSGNGDYEVCDFEIFIVGDGIRYNLGKGGNGDASEAMESLETPEVPDVSGSFYEPEIPNEPDAPDVSELSELPELPELSKLPDMPDGPIVDNWPESIECVADGMNAEPYRLELSIDAPTTLFLSCVTAEGRLRIQIKDSDGKILFDEKNIDMEDFEIPIDTPDTCTVSVWAEQYYGKFEIKPDSVSK